MTNSDDTFYLRAHFSGHVQGVGFRYSTSQLAKGFEVTGYVMNLADGRVELEVEGRESECRQLVETIQDELDSYARKTELSTGRRAKTFTRFRIA